MRGSLNCIGVFCSFQKSGGSGDCAASKIGHCFENEMRQRRTVVSHDVIILSVTSHRLKFCNPHSTHHTSLTTVAVALHQAALHASTHSSPLPGNVVLSTRQAGHSVAKQTNNRGEIDQQKVS